MIPTEKSTVEMPDIPASLKRTASPAAEALAAKHNEAAKKIARTMPNALEEAKAIKTPKAPTSSVLRDAIKGAAVKVVAKTKAKGAQVVGKLAAAPKADKPKSAHKPTTIARTADNPAKSIVPAKFKAIYAANNDTNGTPLNLALKSYTTTKNAEGRDALNLDLLKAVAKENGIDFARYEHLNNGQKRMNVGNKLAGLVKSGKTVVIGKQRFANAEKALAKPTAEHAAA